MLSATSAAASVTLFKESPKISSSSPLELTAKDGLFIATECHLASLPDEDGDTQNDEHPFTPYISQIKRKFPLHLAVVQKDKDACQNILKLLQISGKSSDIYNNLLQTPLHIAVITNQADVVNLLMSHGANPLKPDRYGSTAFHVCAKYNSTESLIKILQHCSPKKADLNVRDYEGLTALHTAVLNGSVSTFKVLVANGSDIDAKDNKGGRTPLVYAIEMNHKKMVEMLLECDASVSQQTYSGDTALHIASGRGLQDIVRLLLRRGADATMKNTHCETPMSLATSPSVSSMLRSQYKTADFPENKSALATADIQYASYVVRNTAVPIPPDLLRSINQPPESKDNIVGGIDRPDGDGSDQMLKNGKKRGRKLKTGELASDSTDSIPVKRIALAGSHIFANNSSKDAMPIIVSVSPMPANPSKNMQSNFSQANSSVKLDLKKSMLPPPPPVYVPELRSHVLSGGDFKLTKQEILQRNQYRNVMDARNVAIVSHLTKLDEVKKEVEEEEEVVVAEEVEVSAEEIIPVESDDVSSNANEKNSDFRQSVIVDDSSCDAPLNFVDKNSDLKSTTTKYMQDFSRNITRSSTFPSSVLQYSSRNSSNVIVQKQPQIDIATALSSNEYDLSPSYKSFTPSASPNSLSQMQYNLSKSKSVPNSPQPSEANLYQLAREGLAVAAMTKNTYSLQSVPRNLPMTNYLKSRPSRQAKIKAGTEELQNLALQGLAVAAMNAANLSEKKSSKLNKARNHGSYDDSDPYKSNVTTIPPHLSKLLEPSNEGPQPQPQLHRSFSTPIKSELMNEKMEMSFVTGRFEKDNSLTSTNALLALAHANARKMNVGQAVSAVSMAKAQNNTIIKQNTMQGGTTSLGDVSESTKLNLRQAIMVKNTPPLPHDKLVRIYNPKSNEIKVFDPQSNEIRVFEPKAENGQIPFKMVMQPCNANTSSSSVPSSPVPGFIKMDKPDSSIKSPAPSPVTVNVASDSSCPTPAAEMRIPDTKKKMINVAILRKNSSKIKSMNRPVIDSQPNASTNSVVIKNPDIMKSVTEDTTNSPDSPTATTTSNFSETEATKMEVETAPEPEIEKKEINDLPESEEIVDKASYESKDDKFEKDTGGSEKVSQVVVPPSKLCEPFPEPEDVENSPKSCSDGKDDVSSDHTIRVEEEEKDNRDSRATSRLKVENFNDKPDVIDNSLAPVVLITCSQQSAVVTESKSMASTTSPGTSLHITASPSMEVNSQTLSTITVGQPPTTSSFFPHQLAYANYGKEYIPVLMPVGAHPAMPSPVAMPQYALPMHKPVEMHPAQMAMAGSSRDTTVIPGQLPFDSSGGVYQIPASAQSLLLNSPQQNMLQFASQCYMHNSLPFELMQQQYLKNALICQQNFFMQNKALASQSGQSVVTQTAPSTQTTNSISKPVAAVTAVPVQKTSQENNAPPQPEHATAEEQPLNLSKKNDKPLNLMKNDRSSSTKGAGASISRARAATVDSPKPVESSSTKCRSTVIKVASSMTNENSSALQTVDLENQSISRASQHLMTIANPSFTTTMSALENQISAGIMMPPPLVVPGPIHPTGPAPSLASLPLPPIHYVNGMPFLVRYSHSM